MQIELIKRPKNPTIIEGFPGFGLVATIVTEFLIKHLNAKPIGYIWSEKILPLASLHEAKVIEPLGIFYDEKDNIVIMQALSFVNGLEWELANSVVELAKELNAKEVISIEGVPTEKTSLDTFFYSNKADKCKAFEKIGVKQLKEGIIMGVTGAVLLKTKETKTPFSCIFIEAHTSFADSEAAAKIIEIIDKYLNLKVDYKPLIEAAKKFESNLKQLLEKTTKATSQKERKELSYMG